MQKSLSKHFRKELERVHTDDGGASAEAMIHYNIHCPYKSGDKRAMCFEKLPKRDTCTECKTKWLDSEVDQ